ncbi:MAG: helix-turn-helix transcriptional regulator [Rhodospirillaceae bacterium]|jgi:ArsR family transcriptional regulator, virulence genes transcriptional regulator|nr:helix-turn-helix transcriptional regulator [Rhodospirillaceae bacterium]|tara:strand:- start:13643 stop:13984 length:342 start_codon:yes stop_codon:yes gene_type:complete
MEIMEEKAEQLAMENNADKAAAFLKSIANRNRILVLCHLIADEWTAGELSESIGVSPANLSQHLTWLKNEGLVKTRREGTVINYSLSEKDVRPLISVLYDMFCERDFSKDQPS